jgi:hypothetical protein
LTPSPYSRNDSVISYPDGGGGSGGASPSSHNMPIDDDNGKVYRNKLDPIGKWHSQQTQDFLHHVMAALGQHHPFLKWICSDVHPWNRKWLQEGAFVAIMFFSSQTMPIDTQHMMMKRFPAHHSHLANMVENSHGMVSPIMHMFIHRIVDL